VAVVVVVVVVVEVVVVVKCPILSLTSSHQGG